MEKLHPDDMKKLPRWAQRHLETCYKNIDDLARDKSTLFRASPKDSRIVLADFHGIGMKTEDDQPLREHQRIKFYPFGPSERSWANYIQFGIDLNREGEINIHGSDVVSIMPHSSNSFNVSLIKERK